MINAVASLYFSPAGEVAKITKKISREVAGQLEDICLGELECNYSDMLGGMLEKRAAGKMNESADSDAAGSTDEDPNCGCKFDRNTVVVMGMPSYYGRIPKPCKEMIGRISGNGAFMIAVITYGSSSYGSSLHDLYLSAENAGFNVISAGAFVVQNAVFNNVDEDRPDAYDMQKIIEFSKLSASKIKRLSGTDINSMRVCPAPLDIASIKNRKPLRIPVRPTTSALCIRCGICVSACPVGAIDPRDPSKVDPRKCISCTACIRACEQGAKRFSGPICSFSKVTLWMLCKKRKDPEWFI